MATRHQTLSTRISTFLLSHRKSYEYTPDLTEVKTQTNNHRNRNNRSHGLLLRETCSTFRTHDPWAICFILLDFCLIIDEIQNLPNEIIPKAVLFIFFIHKIRTTLSEKHWALGTVGSTTGTQVRETAQLLVPVAVTVSRENAGFGVRRSEIWLLCSLALGKWFTPSEPGFLQLLESGLGRVTERLCGKNLGNEGSMPRWWLGRALSEGGACRSGRWGSTVCGAFGRSALLRVSARGGARGGGGGWGWPACSDVRAAAPGSDLKVPLLPLV